MITDTSRIPLHQSNDADEPCQSISSGRAYILRDRVLFGIALTIMITLAAYRAARNAADAFEGGVSVKGGPLD